jgi:hypothetical protein
LVKDVQLKEPASPGSGSPNSKDKKLKESTDSEFPESNANDSKPKQSASPGPGSQNSSDKK